MEEVFKEFSKKQLIDYIQENYEVLSKEYLEKVAIKINESYE